MKTIELANHSRIKNLIRAAFPSYRKKMAFVSVFPEGGIKINSFWEGGSKDEFSIVHVPSMVKKPLPTSTHPYFDVAARGMANVDGKDVSSDSKGNLTLLRLPNEYVLIQSGTFMGQTSTAHIYFPDGEELALPGGVYA